MILLLHSSFEHELRNGISIFEGWDAPVYHHIDFVFVQNICNIAVPLFFLISGFLFFIKEKSFGWQQYKDKLKKRLYSLLVPYIIWNVLILLLYVAVQNLAPSMSTGRNKLISDYTIKDYMMSFWSMSYINEGGVSGPIDSPLWFIRDLMVMMALSPVFYWLIKRLGIIVPLIGTMAYIIGLNIGIQGFSMAALAFFSIGAYLGIAKIDFVMISRDVLKYLAILYLALLVLWVLMMEEELPTWPSRFIVWIGVFLAIGIGAFAVERQSISISTFLTGSTFFLFASHSEILKIAIRLTSRLGINSDMLYTVAYFVCPMITCFLLLALYWVLTKTMPKVASVLSGGR